MPAAAQMRHRGALQRAYTRAGLTLEQLWIRYFAVGGAAGLVELEAYLHGLMPLPPLQRDILAQAANEALDEIATLRVPYSGPLPELRLHQGPLAALVTLLDGAHLAPPGRLPALAALAGQALGVGEVRIYLVDYDQRQLLPVPVADAAAEPLNVDTTLPGRAFRLVETTPSEADGVPRLWLPLLDGVERLGVLEVTLPDPSRLHDPQLREQCRWVATLIGHLITITTHYGDALDAVRRRRPRTPAAELTWRLLPPLTAGTDAFVLAGLIEPSYNAGGDSFDYSLSDTTAYLAIFDAMGHSLGAGLISAAALAAYRSARHNGHLLPGQAQAIDQAVAAQFHDVFLTGVLAELDLATGRLRYIIAGHPPPLLLRDGKVVKTLLGGNRTPLGVDTDELSIGEETLQPGDWLVLYTDGITEARDSTGDFFGETRLVDFLRREAAAGHPPPETVRRLIRAVLDHQIGVLQDDATILLAQWDHQHTLTP